MKINSLKITNFRNIEKADIALDDNPIVVVYGDNGAGKTNLLEAISLFTPGKGMHRHKLSDNTKYGCKFWAIHGDVLSNSLVNKVGISYEKGVRKLKINGEMLKNQSPLSGLGNILWFIPKMDRLFVDSPTYRREFFDRLVFGHFSEHAYNLNCYKHHLRSRLRLLKDNCYSDWVDIEEEQVSIYAEKISCCRNEYLKELEPYLNNINIKLNGSFEMLTDKNICTISDNFKSLRGKDSKFNSSSFGPHRSDIEGSFRLDGVNLKDASTGQHKKAILEILLANSRLTYKKTGEAPIIILDELTSHLDFKTKKYFFDSFLSLGSQIWLTGTEKEMFSGLSNVQYIKVDNGCFY